ncbi:MAG: serine/threonine-protein phosphatase [Candidatus Nanopelagicaceae bacterium]|jgi:serine/threonine protein phosphatase PrpC|nr:serine/threonine-protein phosphatase [Candidatus Nanopelagicaceae bacterium]
MATNLHFSNIAWRSEVGLQREGNEDSGFVSPNILAVADGMGGYIGGEIASSTVITKLAELNPILSNPELDNESREDLLRSSITTMDSAIAEIGAQRPELVGMGTTLTSISLFNNYVLLLHVGDSRAYRIRGKKIEQISHDHTVVQELVDQGRLTLNEIADHPQRSFLTQAIMGKENLTPILVAYPAVKGDKYLVCSDGLTAVVDEGKIVQALQEDLQSAVNTLVDLTYKNGAPDNVTVIATEIGESSLSMAPTSFGAAS